MTPTPSLPASIREALTAYRGAIRKAYSAAQHHAYASEYLQEVCVREDAARAALEAQLLALVAQADRQEAAIRWALGYGEFAPRQAGQGAFWWRTELQQRAFPDGIPGTPPEDTTPHETRTE